MLQFDNEAARKLETIYSSPDVVAQRSATLERLRLRPGEEVIDVGCGPGFLCEQMADCVGPKGRVVGVDVSEDLLAFARGRNTRDWLTYSYGDAAALSSPDASFDLAVSAQALEYVEEPDRALAEMFRVLKPGGRALIMNTDWDRVAWVSSNQDRMMRVRRAWEEHCAHPGCRRPLYHASVPRGSGLQKSARFRSPTRASNRAPTVMVWSSSFVTSSPNVRRWSARACCMG